ncbi:MAG: 50S ribosomal protein L18 [Chloroflexota bacterium]
MSRAMTRVASRKRRHTSIRLTVEGDATRPRLAVFRSLNHIYAQVIDDSRGVTLAAASTLDAALKGAAKRTKVEEAAAVGSAIAERAKAAGVAKVVFDRAGFKYHGRLKALADAARAAGLEF